MSIVERLYAFTPGLRCCATITREYVGRRGAVRQFETCGNPATEAVEIQLDRRTVVRHYCADHFAALAAVVEDKGNG